MPRTLHRKKYLSCSRSCFYPLAEGTIMNRATTDEPRGNHPLCETTRTMQSRPMRIGYSQLHAETPPAIAPRPEMAQAPVFNTIIDILAHSLSRPQGAEANGHRSTANARSSASAENITVAGRWCRTSRMENYFRKRLDSARSDFTRASTIP